MDTQSECGSEFSLSGPEVPVSKEEERQLLLEEGDDQDEHVDITLDVCPNERFDDDETQTRPPSGNDHSPHLKNSSKYMLQ